MNIYDSFFFISFVILIGILIAKIYNIMMLNKYYGIKIGVIIQIVAIISYTVALIISVLNIDNILTSQLLKYARILFYIIFMSTMAEIIIEIGLKAKGPIMANNAIKKYENQ